MSGGKKGPRGIAKDEGGCPWHLDGRVAVITGGGNGLGFDIADALGGAGCNIVISSRRPENAEKNAEVLRQRHRVDVTVLPLELADIRSISQFATSAHAWRGRVDILVNNASGGSGKGTGDLFQRDPTEIATTIQTNLLATILVCREIGRHMVGQQHGKIINIASMAGVIGRNRAIYRQNRLREQPVDYAAAKAGVLGLTRDLAAMLAPHRIQVNAISPGGFEKDTLPARFISAYSAMTPLGRMGRYGADIKGAALFLASAASDYITGQNLVLDGGFSVVK